MAEKTVKKKGRSGMVGEIFYFLKTYKMWWLSPIIILILLLGVVILFGGSEMALTIYALF